MPCTFPAVALITLYSLLKPPSLRDQKFHTGRVHVHRFSEMDRHTLQSAMDTATVWMFVSSQNSY